jgi:hypothetical protein
MAYKNNKGENLYMHGWLQADPDSNDFRPTTGGNTVWAKTKREAIKKVNDRRKEFEKDNPRHTKLRVNPDVIQRARSYDEHASYDFGLYMLTV